MSSTEANIMIINPGPWPSPGWTLYVSNLQEESTELSIYKLFSPFGAVTSINAMADPVSGKSKGFGFINMPQYDSAFEAVRLLHGTATGPGKTLNVSFKAGKKMKKSFPSSKAATQVEAWVYRGLIPRSSSRTVFNLF